MIIGQDEAIATFRKAWDSRRLHHAWLLAGPRGVGKGTIARQMALRVLADAAGPPSPRDPLVPPVDHPTVRLVEAGSHPDYRLLERVENKSGTNLNRNITVDQVRSLGDLLGVTPSLSDWRVIVIDSVDDLEPSGANALLKMLEEPPPRTLFLLVSHVPGRLLPTIRSRCRRLDFEKLADDAMTSLLIASDSTISADATTRLAALAAGSPGRAMAMARLDVSELEREARAIIATGDPDNARRSSLSAMLGPKGAAERYDAFLRLVPSLIAAEATVREGEARRKALDAYQAARETAAIAPRLSMPADTTVFQLGSILASLA